MTCREAIEWLLEAEPDELAGRGGGAAAEHVRACVRCRAVAARLLEAQAMLAAELMVPPRVGVEEAIEEVLGAAAGQSAPPGTAGAGGIGPALPLRDPGDGAASAPPSGWGGRGVAAGGGVRRGRQALRSLLPLAAAAAVALLLVRHDVPPPAFEDVTRPRSVAPAPPAALPTVIAPEGRNAALFHTSDRRITVVWIY
ncbi:MAG TPA: hypothetical protein VIL18_11650 [Longimicrobiales bacterium]